MKGRGTAVRATIALAFSCCALLPASGATAAVTFAPEQRPAGSPNATAVAVTDLDVDGFDDVLFTTESEHIRYWFGSDSGIPFVQTCIACAGDAPAGIVAGALPDGRPYFATANSGSGDVSVVTGASFGDKFTFAAGDSPSAIAAGDFDRPSSQYVDLADPDLAVVNRDSNDLTMLAGKPTVPPFGSEPFSSSGDPVGVGNSPQAIAAGDLDGGGHDDIVTANFADGTVSVLIGNPFLSPVRHTLAVGESPAGVVAADLSGDGNRDIAVANRLPDTVTVLLGNGEGLFSQPRTFPAGDSPRALAVADLSGDGRPDLAVANGVTSEVTVLTGDGGGAFGSARRFDVGSEPVSVAAGDINGDGASDLVTANRNSGGVSLLLNSAATGVSPTRVDFPATRVGRRSGLRTVTVTNTGSAPLDVASVTPEGSGAGSYAVESETCTAAALPAGGKCTARVRFVPTATGPAIATLRFASNAPGSPHGVTLSGTGTQPGVSLSPGSVAFPDTRVGTQSAEKSVTVRNSGGAPLRVSKVSVGGTDASAFELVSQSCTGGTIAPGGTCRANLRFAPTAPVAASATLTVASDAPDGPHVATLSGRGIQSEVTLSPASVSFPNTPVGGQSAPRTVTVENTGTADLHVSSVALAGPSPGSFSIVSLSCGGAPVPPGDSCTVSLRFTPRAKGPVSATLQIASDAPGSPDLAALSGRGTQCMFFGLLCS